MSSVVASRELPSYKNDGYIWECVKQKSTPQDPGINYIFKLRNEFDETKQSRIAIKNGSAGDAVSTIEKICRLNYNRQNEEIFPAVELSERFIKQRNLFNKPTLNYLGYRAKEKEDGFYITLPDKERLEARWKKLQQEPGNAHLEDLSITSSEGTATDAKFLDAFFNSDVLLSTGREYVHDQLLHVMRMLNMKSNPAANYSYYKTCFRTKVQKALNAIEMVREQHKRQTTVSKDEEILLKITEHSISIVVDLITSALSTKHFFDLMVYWWKGPLLSSIIWNDESYRKKLNEFGVVNEAEFTAAKIQIYWHAIRINYTASRHQQVLNGTQHS